MVESVIFNEYPSLSDLCARDCSIARSRLKRDRMNHKEPLYDLIGCASIIAVYFSSLPSVPLPGKWTPYSGFCLSIRLAMARASSVEASGLSENERR